MAKQNSKKDEGTVITHFEKANAPEMAALMTKEERIAMIKENKKKAEPAK